MKISEKECKKIAKRKAREQGRIIIQFRIRKAIIDFLSHFH